MVENLSKSVDFKIVIIEDILETANHLRDFLEKNMVSLLSNEENLMEFILLHNIDHFKERVFYNNFQKVLFIIDLNLGNRRETEGLEIISILNGMKDLDYQIVVYSANTDLIDETKNRVDALIKKGHHKENYEQILSLTKNFFLTPHEIKRKLVETSNLKKSKKNHIYTPSFDGETILGSDQLNISKDSHALANLITNKGLSPPLSIGIFADWGSGKSFFMQKIDERVKELVEY